MVFTKPNNVHSFRLGLCLHQAIICMSTQANFQIMVAYF